MKRVIPYPLLLITAIILDRVVISSSQFGIDQSLRAMFILLLGGIVAMMIIQYFIRDWHYTSFIVVMIPVALITYRSSYSFIKANFPNQANALGIALLIVLGMLYAMAVHHKVWKSVHNPAQITTYFNLVFTLLLIFQVVRLGQDSHSMFTNIGHPQSTLIQVTGNDPKLKKGSSPDIYVIILDGYARQDVLQSIYRHDNSGFIDWLENQGFYVASNSHSNYIQTPYTMSSFWNFDYLETWDSSYEYAKYLFDPIQNNRVFRLLDDIGYTTVSFGGVSDYTEIKKADIYLSNFLPLNNFETLLLTDSPLEPLSNIIDLHLPLNTYKTHRERMLYQLDTLKEIPVNISGPKIVYAHILAPHPPFVFYQDGGISEPQRPYTLAEGAGFQDSQEAYQNGYRQQVGFVNQEIMKVIDAIRSKSETPPIILIMSDHGPASMFNWNFEDPGCLWERTSNLYAILLPGHENDGTVYSSISPVNTFRMIFNTYFDADLPLLEDRSYMMAWQHPTLKVDVTNVRDSLEGCTLSEEQTHR
jgi:hypothetical protein